MFFATVVAVILIVLSGLFGPLLMKRLLIKLATWDSPYRPILQMPATGSFMPIEKWVDDAKTPQGSAQAVKVGELATIVSSVKGYKLDPNGIFIPDVSRSRQAALKDDDVLEELGLVWVGFGRRPWRGSFSYISWEVDSKGVGKLVEKTRGGPEVFFRHTLALQLTVLTKDNTEVYLTIVFTVEILHPELALFGSGAWIKNTYSSVTQICREYASTRTEIKLREERDGTELNNLVDLIKNLSRTVTADGKVGLFESDGVIISVARFESFTFKSASPELATAREAILIATSRNNAATQDAERITKLGVAEGARFAAIAAVGPGALQLAAAEATAKALESGGAKAVVSVGNTNIPPAIIISP